jgi:hypothetical protein
LIFNDPDWEGWNKLWKGDNLFDDFDDDEKTKLSQCIPSEEACESIVFFFIINYVYIPLNCCSRSGRSGALKKENEIFSFKYNNKFTFTSIR